MASRLEKYQSMVSTKEDTNNKYDESAMSVSMRSTLHAEYAKNTKRSICKSALTNNEQTNSKVTPISVKFKPKYNVLIEDNNDLKFKNAFE